MERAVILGYLVSCEGECGVRMLVNRNIAHWCGVCVERAAEESGEDYLPLGEVQL
jgi:hypothetical protein